MWERYNEVYELNARVLSMGYLEPVPKEETPATTVRGAQKIRASDTFLVRLL
jgi:hypothetical protein